jgi:hypothetical protein
VSSVKLMSRYSRSVLLHRIESAHVEDPALIPKPRSVVKRERRPGTIGRGENCQRRLGRRGMKCSLNAFLVSASSRLSAPRRSCLSHRPRPRLAIHPCAPRLNLLLM